MAKKEWIRVSTAAGLRDVDRQAIYYHVNQGHLKTKVIDEVTFVEKSEVMSLKLRREEKDEHDSSSSRDQLPRRTA